jgi:hypothetical protein
MAGINMAGSELWQKQVFFATELVPRLLVKAKEFGFVYTLGDAFRDPRVHGEIGVKMGYGHRNSAHKNKLAIDLNLFLPNGTYLGKTEDHKQLGEWWESIGGTWGGRFDDGNHYSLEHKGQK